MQLMAGRILVCTTCVVELFIIPLTYRLRYTESACLRFSWEVNRYFISHKCKRNIRYCPRNCMILSIFRRASLEYYFLRSYSFELMSSRIDENLNIKAPQNSCTHTRKNDSIPFSYKKSEITVNLIPLVNYFHTITITGFLNICVSLSWGTRSANILVNTRERSCTMAWSLQLSEAYDVRCLYTCICI